MLAKIDTNGDILLLLRPLDGHAFVEAARMAALQAHAAATGQMAPRVTLDVSLSAAFDSASHPRGQPGNAGQFGPGHGSGVRLVPTKRKPKKPKPDQPEKKNSSPAETPATAPHAELSDTQKADGIVGKFKGKITETIDKIPGGAWLRGRMAKVNEKITERYGATAARKIVASGVAISWGAFVVGPMVGWPNYIPVSVAMLPGLVLAELYHQIGDHKEGKPPVSMSSWDESKHKRGQPGNAGQFGPGGGHKATESPDHSEDSPAVYTPDLQAKNPATGVVDHARVGVPAMSVPPPPAEIPRLPNLSKKQRKVESRFAEAYLADPDKLARKYLKALRKRTVGEAANIFATDDVKALNPDWNPSAIAAGEELDQDTKRAMAKFNTAVHQTANAIAKRAFLMHLDDVAKMPPDKRRVLVTNGGCAAGKGSTLSRSTDPKDPHFGMLTPAEQVGAIWDAAGEQNATENAWVYSECKKRGIKVTCAYVWADPKDTWDGSDRGVIRRAMRKGRMVDARLFADSYAEGARNMKDFVDSHAGKEGLDFVFIDNRSKAAPKLLNAFPDETLQWDAEKIYQSAVAGLAKHKNDLDPTLVKGGLNGTKIWGPPHGSPIGESGARIA